MLRDIVIIDEERCDGCGLCVPACHEGALRIVNGKARLVADRLCDGLGACLGHCPRGAIRIEQRPAEAFDEAAVAAARTACPASPGPKSPRVPAPDHSAGGCPGTRMAQFARPTQAGCAPRETGSELTHWPVQLRLLPPTAPVLRGARLLIAADCVPVAYADFHRELLHGRAIAIACPKLDDSRGYVEKLAAMLINGEPESVTIAHMEVPCCSGILRMVLEAAHRANYSGPLEDVVISTDGRVLARRMLTACETEI
jgi:NAD-dependent dihydropyrimidine dehydrogenase PreA subunit